MVEVGQAIEFIAVNGTAGVTFLQTSVPDPTRPANSTGPLALVPSA